MKTYIAMLRGINVSGQKKIKMDELRQAMEDLGFSDIATYIQSGNIVFKSANEKADKIAQKVEAMIKSTFGFDVPAIIRDKNEMAKVIKCNPYKKQDLSKVLVAFLKTTPKYFPQDEINQIKAKPEEINLIGQEVYLYCPNGFGTSKLSNNFIEKKLEVDATTRNWKTVNQLLTMAQQKIRGARS